MTEVPDLQLPQESFTSRLGPEQRRRVRPRIRPLGRFTLTRPRNTIPNGLSHVSWIARGLVHDVLERIDSPVQTTTSDRSVTYFRLAALPPAWIEARHFLIEDHVGHLYLFDPTDASLDRIGAAEANVLMQWYELSQAVTWYTRPELIQKLTAIASRIRLTSERDDPERYCTFMSPDTLADTNLDLCC